MEGHHGEGDHNKTVETTDRGMFDFMKKRDEDAAMVDAHKPDNVKEKEKPSFMEKLHRSNSNSSSSSDEEEAGEGGEKKKKKGLKEKIKEKIASDKEAIEHKETPIPTENPEEKKGFLDKMKEKLPGQHKKAEGEPKQKGILEKIKEKIPGSLGHKTEDGKPKEN